MKSDLTIKNSYCTIPQTKFRKWDEMDVLLWKLGKNDSRRRSGVYYLNAYKDAYVGNDSNLLIVFYVQIMPDDLVMQLHRF